MSRFFNRNYLRLPPCVTRYFKGSFWRFEPSSRTLLIGEQPNPWKLLHLQDRMSRHRCRYFSPFTRRIGLYLHPPYIAFAIRLGADVLWKFYFHLPDRRSQSRASLYGVITQFIFHWRNQIFFQCFF